MKKFVIIGLFLLTAGVLSLSQKGERWKVPDSPLPRPEVSISGWKDSTVNPKARANSMADIQVKEKIYQPHAGQSLWEIERQYSDHTEKELREEVNKAEAEMDQDRLIEKANRQSLTGVEVDHLALLLRKKAMLHKILIERELEKRSL